MTNPHPQAELLRLAADNKDQLFECDEFVSEVRFHTILKVIQYPQYNWRPVIIKPDVVEYCNMYKDRSSLWIRNKVLLDGDGAEDRLCILKRTINGETGKITVEVIE